ncbi:MAG: aminotransferase class V-fold PLP-dependent enzyme [Acidobacteriota bacterium]|nr:aminotransferase class V-fold PLP-dependent enzyme [Acidobacteriota bacterium]
MPIDRRRLLASLTTGLAWNAAGRPMLAAPAAPPPENALRRPDGSVDWRAVRDLFPLATDRMHFASFLFVSQPAPVAAAIERFRRQLDADPTWLEDAAFGDSSSEGRPFQAVKEALAAYVGGAPEEICLTSNTTGALAMAYQGLSIRADQEIVTTEHDHYSHHESIRLSAARSGAAVRYVSLYDKAGDARGEEIVARAARAIGPKTRALGVTWVHSSTGVKLPVAAIAKAVEKANRGRADADRCLLIVDGVHGFGNQDLDIARLGCDFFASGTHKWLFAPRGTGFLWGRKDVWRELRPTIPTFDPDGIPQTFGAWMDRKPLPPTQAAFVSPGGFLAFENLLAVPAAVELHRAIGRDRIAARVAELNAAFREGAAKLPGVTLHTPRDPELSAGISCYEVAGLSPQEVVRRLAAKRMRTTTSPYKVSYARVSGGVMNFPEEIDAVLREIRALWARAA